MNYKDSVVSDDDRSFIESSELLENAIFLRKRPAKSFVSKSPDRLKFSTSLSSKSVRRRTQDEEEEEITSVRANCRSINGNEHSQAPSRIVRVKRSALDKLAMIGSQKTLERTPSRVVNRIEGQQSSVKASESKAAVTVSESDSDSDVNSPMRDEKSITDVGSSQEELQSVYSIENVDDNTSPCPLEKLLARQASILKDFVVPMPKKKKKEKTKSELIKQACGTLSIEEYWDIELSFLAPDFFKSKEAKMERTEKVRKGIRAYEGLKITHENSYDMSVIYEVDFAPAIKAGQDSKTYDQFKVTVGQYARMCVMLKKCKLETLCDPGNLFRIICNKDLADAFLGYFHIRAAPATVTLKANTLVRLADNAAFCFRSSDPELSAKAELTARFLRRSSASHKQISRHLMKEKTRYEQET